MKIEIGQRAEYFDGCYLQDVIIRGRNFLRNTVQVIFLGGERKGECLSVPLTSLVFDNSNVDKVA